MSNQQVEQEEVEDYVKEFEEKLVRNDDGEVVGINQDALPNVYLAKNPQEGRQVLMTSFDAGTSDTEYQENLEEALPRVITVSEYNMAQTGALEGLPYEVIRFDGMHPAIYRTFKPFIDELDKFGDKQERTAFIFRFFINDEDGKPHPVKYSFEEDIRKMEEQAQG